MAAEDDDTAEALVDEADQLVTSANDLIREGWNTYQTALSEAGIGATSGAPTGLPPALGG
jgi:hypothetical protein